MFFETFANSKSEEQELAGVNGILNETTTNENGMKHYDLSQKLNHEDAIEILNKLNLIDHSNDFLIPKRNLTDKERVKSLDDNSQAFRKENSYSKQQLDKK